jgi:rubrerythrin
VATDRMHSPAWDEYDRTLRSGIGEGIRLTMDDNGFVRYSERVSETWLYPWEYVCPACGTVHEGDPANRKLTE